MLGHLKKGFDREDVRRTAELARESGLRCTWFFLLGGPGEIRETVEETVSFVEESLNSSRFLTIMMTGIRILPGTELAQRAKEEGVIGPADDLCEPAFYFAPGLDEGWVLRRIGKAIRRCPSMVHGAEETGSAVERGFNSALHWLGFAPPYYRLLPLLLRLPPIAAARARNTGVRPARRRTTSSLNQERARIN